MASLGRVIELALLSLVLQRVESIQLTISPQHAHLNMAGDNLTVMCLANGPITRCQFNFVKDQIKWEGPLIDLTEDAGTVLKRMQTDVSNINYSYRGTGLQSGQCGITLHLTNFKRWMVGCRVKAARGGWKYAIMSLTADQSSSVNVTATPQSIVAVPGLSASILCKADGPLQGCRIDTPGSQFGQLNLDEEDESSSSTDEHRYHGAGVENRECGVTFPLVTEGLNGYAFCGVVTASGNLQRVGIPFVVARVPYRPYMKFSSTNLAEGSPFRATCTVKGGRPVANITWYLDDEVVRRDDENDVTDLVWRWPTSLQKITQVLRRKLVATDDGKKLRCEVDHVTLSRPLVAKKTIRFTRTSGCPKLTSETVLISCYISAGEAIDCNAFHDLGTEAKLACKPGFEQNPDMNYTTIQCMSGNTWNDSVIDYCQPDCGRRKSNSVTLLIARGKQSRMGEFPWHVGIYKTSTNDSTPVQICGGSLISPNVVITAAHCFWNEQNVAKHNASLYKMAAGKHHRLWEEGDAGVQRRDVLQVETNLFSGRLTNFVADIAMLRPDTPFDINMRVNLICVDWDNNLEYFQLLEGNSGVVPGWGFTEENKQSDTLKDVALPFVDSTTCMNSLSNEKKKYFTEDKFCAGFVNQDTSVCRGDSGGGLVFLDAGTNRHFLRGIVSIAFTPDMMTSGGCYAHHYTGFTDFSKHIPWTRETMTRFN